MKHQGTNACGEPYSSAYVARKPVQQPHADDGRTRQEFAEECDINVLMAGYERSGIISHINPLPPQYFDASNLPDLAESLAIYDQAQTAFMTLPASVRATFDNDPLKFVEYAENPANLEQMRDWNLAPRPPVPDAAPTPRESPPQE